MSVERLAEFHEDLERVLFDEVPADQLIEAVDEEILQVRKEMNAMTDKRVAIEYLEDLKAIRISAKELED